ncbi:MAG: DNA-processing protein DprA [Dialister sp.]
MQDKILPSSFLPAVLIKYILRKIKICFKRLLVQESTLISEYSPGTPPLGRQFPARNRIIAGMSRGILVVEAAERSGALITSDFALEEGRDVFSVPGNIWLPSSKGTNQLVRNGAICCTEAKDILSEYNWLPEEEGTEKVSYEELTLEEEVVYRFCCIGDEVTAEEILIQSGMPVTKISTLLLQLQLKGYIKEIDPSRFVMTGK